MNILETTEMLKRMPDADLMQTQSPDVSEWMRAMEINRRNRTRQGERTGTGAPPTVAQQLTQQISRQQPIATQVPQPGAQSQSRGLGSMPQGGPKGYAAGGIVTFRDGGLVAAAKTFGYDATDETDAQAWLEKTRYSSTDPRIRAGVASALQREIEQQSGIRAATEAQREAAITADPSRLSRYTSQGELIRPEFAAPQAQAGIPAAVAPPATIRPPPAVGRQAPPTVPAPDSQARSAVSGIGGVQIDPRSMRLPQQRPEIDVMSEAAKRAAYYGEDEYGKAVAADLAARREQAAATREGQRGQTLLDLGLGMMVEGGKSGATFLGATGAAGIEALKGSREREAALSAEEEEMRKEGLGEVGRKQTEKRTGIAAAITAADVRDSENLQALADGDKILNGVTIKNVELKQDMLKANAQLAAAVKSAESAAKSQDDANKRTALTAMSAAVDDMAKAYTTLKADLTADPKDIANASAALQIAITTRDQMVTQVGGLTFKTQPPTGRALGAV